MAYVDEVLADSPLAYYRLGEASGTTMADSSGNGRDGVYNNTPTLGQTGIPGASGTSVSFAAASSEDGTVANGSWMDVGSALTLEVWAKPTVGAANGWAFSRGNTSSNPYGLVVGPSHAQMLIRWGTATANNSATITGLTLDDGNWHHIVGTYDGTDIKIYVDGTLRTTTNEPGRTIWVTTANLRVGSRGNSYFDGGLDEAALYGTALSSTRISTHYTAGTATGNSGTLAGTFPTFSGNFSMTTPQSSLYYTVEIAFNAGYNTPAASRTWTNVTSYMLAVSGIDIGHGRSDERSTADANSLRLTLKNSDGRFTPGLASSPYYPNVKIGRPVRVKATPAGGSESVRFVGYIDEWPLEWPAIVDTFATTAISASSRMARLGLSAPLGNVIYEEFKRDNPLAHYMLDTRSDATGDNPDLTQTGSGAAVVFTGTGPGTDGIQAATFAGGKYLSVVPSTSLFPGGSGSGSVECFFTTSSSSNQAIAHVGETSDFNAIHIAINNGDIEWQAGGSSDTITGSYDDGNVHHVAIAIGPVNMRVYVDGVQQGPTYATGTLTELSVATVGGGGAGGAYARPTLTGSVSHFAIYASELSAARVADHRDAGVDGFESEPADDRLARYAAYASVPTAETSFDTDAVTPMDHIDTTGKGAAEVMRTVESTDGGVLFDARDGTLTYNARGDRYTAPVAFTLNASSGQVEASYSPKLDRSALINDVVATITGTETSVHAYNQTSIDDYGLHADQIELSTTDEAEAHGAAWWRVNAYDEPAARAPQLGVEIAHLSAALQAQILAAAVGTKFTVSGLPSQSDSSSKNFFIEGYAETIAESTHRIEFNVSPAGPAESVLILDDSTRGQLDQEVLGY